MPKKTAFAYLDESGDLGWKLDQPYGNKGSSRFFTIAVAIGQQTSYHKFGSVIKKLHQSQGWTSAKEKKWATVGDVPRSLFCQLAAKALAQNTELSVLVGVCHKQHTAHYLRGADVRLVHPHLSEPELQKMEAKLKGRSHLVYAMMVADMLAKHMPEVDAFSYCPDELNEGQRTLEQILTYRLRILDQHDIELNHVQGEKAMQGGLTFADMVAGAVWEGYEREDKKYLDILGPYIKLVEFK